MTAVPESLTSINQDQLRYPPPVVTRDWVSSRPIELFEQSATNRTPIRQVVGEDPVEFIQTFIRNYPSGTWVVRERERLNRAIERSAAQEDTQADLTTRP